MFAKKLNFRNKINMFFNWFENVRKISIYGVILEGGTAGDRPSRAINAYFSQILK